jgi:uncharacterized protein
MRRIVIDTNVLISAAVFPNSVPRQTVEKALKNDILLLSEPTMHEMTEVLSRLKFDPYIRAEQRIRFLAQLASRGRIRSHHSTHPRVPRP